MADSEHNVTININGNANVAVNALNKVKTGLNGIMNAGKMVFGFISKINWVVGGIQTVISAFQKLQEWIGRAAEQAKALRHEIESASYESSIANAASAYEKLNKKIAKSIKLERERNDILDKRKETERDIEDASLELKKQQEIASLDPTEAYYNEKKSAIESKYASKASSIAETRAKEDSRRGAGKLYKEADSRERDANDLERLYKQALAREVKVRERNFAAGMAARSGNENDIKRKEETEKQWKEAYEFAEKIKEQMEKAKEEAQSLRMRAGEMAGGNLAAKIRNEASQLSISTKAKAESAKTEKENKKKVEDATRKRQMEEELYALDPKSKTYDFDRKEIERKYAAAEAERNVRRAKDELDRLFPEDEEIKKKKDAAIAALDPKSDTYESDKNEIEREYDTRPSDNTGTRSRLESDLRVAEEELAVLNLRNTAERRKDMTEADLRKADELESFSARAAAADGVSQNRLTAMGLGSGVSADGKIQSEMRTVIGILKETLKATRDNKPVENNSVSVYGE